MDRNLVDMITSYQDINGSEIDILPSEPSPLEFMRYVARNRPFVVRKTLNSWQASKKWTAHYLRHTLAEATIKVAITPYGNADAPVYSECHGDTYFVKPLEKEVPFLEFLARVGNHDKAWCGNGDSPEEVWYAQTQNDNLRGEYSALLPEVPVSIPWAQIALEQEPEAVNLWIGNDKSVTALHRDNYENIYCQIVGQKHFVLIPPTEAICARERLLHQARYQKEHGKWTIYREDDSTPVPCATWDPDSRTRASNEDGSLECSAADSYQKLCRPIRVTLDAGDLLYLPSLWFHKVSQSVGVDGICIAINYWYDMDFGGSLFSTSQYFRDVALKMHSNEVNA